MQKYYFLIGGIILGIVGATFVVGQGYGNQVKPQNNVAVEKVYESDNRLDNAQASLQQKDKELETLSAKNIELQKTNLQLMKKTSAKMLVFDNEQAGFSFSYPEWFGKLTFRIEKGEQGKYFYGVFANVPVEFGGVTKDFEEGREARFGDYRGSDEWMSGYKVVDVLNIPGGTVKVLKGESNDNDYPGAGLPAGTFGALVKLKGPLFYGVAFQDDDEKLVTLEEFQSVLKTLVIK